MSAFSKLKKQVGSIDRLNKEIEKMSNPYQNNDDRFWYPDVDKAGNGKATIRFLPTPPQDLDKDGLPWVRVFEHSFKGPSGKWYIENSRTTIGLDDPLAELNNELWNSGDEDDKETVRKQKRKTVYISNVYIIKDELNPENEGKVKLFKYGKKVFEKINSMMNPADSDDPRVNPFDLWEGANFKLIITKVAGYRNYDSSKFVERGPLSQDEDFMEKVYEQSSSLLAFLEPSNFKSYDELKKQLDRALGVVTSKPARKVEEKVEPAKVEVKDVDEDDAPFDLPPKGAADDDDAEYLKHFQKMADE